MNNSDNESLFSQDYLTLLKTLNDKELNYHLPSIVWLFAVSLFGIPGNIFTLYFYGTGFLKSNYKLFIVTVASVDLLSCCVAIPLEIFILFLGYVKDDRYETVCKLSRFSNCFLANTSAFVLTLIAVERYIKVCRPLNSQLNSVFAQKLCTGAIVFGVIVALPSAFVFGKKTLKLVVNGHDIKAVDCSVSDYASRSKKGIFYLVTMFVITVVGIILNIILYSLIGLKIKRESVRKSKEAKQSIGIANIICHKPGENVEEKGGTDDRNGHNLKVDYDADVGGSGLSTDNHFSTETLSVEKPRVILENVDRNINNCDTGAEEKKNRKKQSNKQFSSKVLNRDRANKTLRAMFIITAVYVVSYIPTLIILTIESVVKGFYEDKTFAERAVSNVFVRLYFLNCGVNPFVYMLCDSNLRNAIKRVLSSLKLRLCD